MGAAKKSAIVFGVVILLFIAWLAIPESEEAPTTTTTELQIGTVTELVVPSESVTPQYDDALVKSFHGNIDDIQALPREILKQCRAVNNYSDYLIFATIIAATSDEVNELIIGTGVIMDNLVLKGYGNHPTVGPKITEVRQLFNSNVSCIEGLLAKYN